MDQPGEVVRSAARRAVARLSAERGSARAAAPSPDPCVGPAAGESGGADGPARASADRSSAGWGPLGEGVALVTLERLRPGGPLPSELSERGAPLAGEEAAPSDLARGPAGSATPVGPECSESSGGSGGAAGEVPGGSPAEGTPPDGVGS